VLYLIGKKLGSRILGLSASLLAIFREVNFIRASNIANVSNSKLLMTDFPYTLGISLLALATIGWLQEKKERSLSLILIGGLLAVNCLLRPQTLILVPFYAVLALIRNWKDWKRVITAFGVIALVLLLTISPLLARNYTVGQYFWFDAPSYMSKFASSYALSNIAEDEDSSETASAAADAAQPAGSMLAVFSAGNHKLMTGIVNNFSATCFRLSCNFRSARIPPFLCRNTKPFRKTSGRAWAFTTIRSITFWRC
jgi:4-amino-4-deoxy-L-arabinose transferase and related glycosyltransferases of PMT family